MAERLALNDQDREVLAFLAVNRMAQSDHVMVLLGAQRTPELAGERLAGLARAGLVRRERLIRPSLIAFESRARGWV